MPADPEAAGAESVPTHSMSLETIVGYKAIDLGTIGDHRTDNSVGIQLTETGEVLAIAAQVLGSSDPHLSFVWKDGVVSELGVFPGGHPFLPYTLALDINESGQVVGASNSQGFHPFLWEGGDLLDLGTLGAAFAINESGTISGYRRNEAGDLRAVLWQDGAMVELGTLGGEDSQAHLINEAGQVLGRSYAADGTIHSFLWDDGMMTDLGLSEANLGTARSVGGLNEAGDAAVTGLASDGSRRATLWRDGTLTDLGPGRAIAINDAGHVVIQTDDGRVLVWSAGTTVDVGHLGGGEAQAGGSYALNAAINAQGWVVGGSRREDGHTRPFLWNGTMMDLGTLGGDYGRAYAINDVGYVVGESRQADGQNHATLWRPIAVEEAVQDLVDDVGSLEDLGAINQGQAHALSNHLTIAAAMIEDGKTTPAANKLQAFINQVEGMISGSDPVLSPEEGQPLIDAANALLSSATG